MLFTRKCHELALFDVIFIRRTAPGNSADTHPTQLYDTPVSVDKVQKQTRFCVVRERKSICCSTFSVVYFSSWQCSPHD